MTIRETVAGALALMLTLCLAAACAPSRAPEPPRHSGFLRDYSRLSETRDAGGVALWRWIGPGLDRSRYDTLFIDPIALFPQPKENERVSRETLRGIADYADAEARVLFGHILPLTDRPGPRTLRLRLAISALDAGPRARNAWDVLPDALIVAAGAGPGPDDAVVFGEMELVDSGGAVLAQAVREGFGTGLNDGGAPLQPAQIQPLLDSWLPDFAGLLAQALNPAAPAGAPSR